MFPLKIRFCYNLASFLMMLLVFVPEDFYNPEFPNFYPLTCHTHHYIQCTFMSTFDLLWVFLMLLSALFWDSLDAAIIEILEQFLQRKCEVTAAFHPLQMLLYLSFRKDKGLYITCRKFPLDSWDHVIEIYYSLFQVFTKIN